MRREGRLDNGNTHIDVEVEFDQDGQTGRLFPQAEAGTQILRRIFDRPAAPVLTVDDESYPIEFGGEPPKDNAATRRDGYGFKKIKE